MPVPVISPRSTGRVKTELLDYDPHNPRLVEDGAKNPSEAQVIQALAETADLAEIVHSIAANGYIDIEPLIVQQKGDRLVVLEGNHRLAAIRVLQNPALAKAAKVDIPSEIGPEVLESLESVTVYAVSDPEQARDFIGFKHINGPHRWDALAKARFAANWYRQAKADRITLEAIAQRLGDRHDTVVRLVNGIFVLDQAEEAGVFTLQDRYPGRKFAFSHLYTALTRRGYRDFLGLPPEWRNVDPTPNPVPTDKIENLQKVMTWLYGSKNDNIEPVVVSQNPHIRQLDAVLQSSRARSIMLMRNQLREAVAEVESKSDRFERSLINAKQEAENAMAQVTAYDPEDTTLLEISFDLKRTSDLLHRNMDEMHQAARVPKSRK